MFENSHDWYNEEEYNEKGKVVYFTQPLDDIFLEEEKKCFKRGYLQHGSISTYSLYNNEVGDNNSVYYEGCPYFMETNVKDSEIDGGFVVIYVPCNTLEVPQFPDHDKSPELPRKV